MSNTDRSYTTFYGPLVQGQNIQAGTASKGASFSASGQTAAVVSNTVAVVAVLEETVAASLVTDVFKIVIFTVVL